MRKGLLFTFALLFVFLAGAWLSYQWSNSTHEEETTVAASVLLERVREVCQLVTVQGEFTEIYHETNLRKLTLYLPIPTQWQFSKKALLQVTGKVLVGYDMNQVSIKIDSAAQLITLTNLPQPSILAIDHDIKYLNLEESFFNEFSPEDYTQMNANAKNLLREKASESDLIDQAKQQGIYLLDALDFMAKGIGWRVVYEHSSYDLKS